MRLIVNVDALYKADNNVAVDFINIFKGFEAFYPLQLFRGVVSALVKLGFKLF